MIANFDIAGRLDLNFRAARAGSKLFTFLNAASAAYDVSDIPFVLNVKSNEHATTNLFQLTVGSGLAIDENEMTVTVTETQSNVAKEFNYWELYNPTDKQTWLCGSAYFIKREPKDSDDSITVTVNLEPDEVTVTISSSGTGSTDDGSL